MFFNRLAYCVLLLAMFSTTGCAVKAMPITLGPINGDLKPAVRVTGKVHIMPVLDEASVEKFEGGLYSTLSYVKKLEDLRFVSKSNPADVVSQSITSCLTQSGLTVSSGPTVPDDADFVLEPRFRYIRVGTTRAGDIGNMIVTSVLGSSTDILHGFLMTTNKITNNKSQAITTGNYFGDEFTTLYFSYEGGAEKAFRQVQENYCGWLQKKVADFKADPVEAQNANIQETIALNKRLGNK